MKLRSVDLSATRQRPLPVNCEALPLLAETLSSPRKPRRWEALVRSTTPAFVSRMFRGLEEARASGEAKLRSRNSEARRRSPERSSRRSLSVATTVNREEFCRATFCFQVGSARALTSAFSFLFPASWWLRWCFSPQTPASRGSPFRRRGTRRHHGGRNLPADA